jgi:D-sedoheptulose 7-phosphate isomerase
MKTKKNIDEIITDYLDEIITNVDTLKHQSEAITRIVKLLKDKKDNTIFICGNGGSASTASHMANDFRKMAGLKAFSLTDSVPLITAWANDDSYENIFVRQLESVAKNGDVLIAISGSGKSPNIVKAVTWAKKHKLCSIALIGLDGGYLKDKDLVTEYLHIPTDMLHSEDMHLIIEHLLTKILSDS